MRTERFCCCPPMAALVLVAAICLEVGCQHDGSGIGPVEPPRQGEGGSGGTGPAPGRADRPPAGGTAGGLEEPGGLPADAGSAEAVPPDAAGSVEAGIAPDGRVGATGAPAADASVPSDGAPSSPEAAAFCPPTPDLALCLRFESGLVDESTHGLPVQGQGRFAPGAEGRALQVGPQDRYVVPESPVLDSESIVLEATVRADGLGRRMGILDNPGQYGLYVLPSGNVMCSGRGGYALEGSLVPERWTRLRCTFDTSRVVLWIDGNRVAEGPSAPLATARTDGLRIGWEEEPGRFFQGLIDNVRIWRTLPAAGASR